jgi:putative oxidoreductase
MAFSWFDFAPRFVIITNMKNIIFYRGGGRWTGYGPLVLRVVVGIIFAVHGYQKITMGPEAFGGFLSSLGIPAPVFFAYLVTYVEFLGGIALVLGLLTFWSSVLLAIDMLVAILAVHLQSGFYVNQGGYEFALLLLASAVALALMGPGALSGEEKMHGRRE